MVRSLQPSLFLGLLGLQPSVLVDQVWHSKYEVSEKSSQTSIWITQESHNTSAPVRSHESGVSSRSTVSNGLRSLLAFFWKMDDDADSGLRSVCRPATNHTHENIRSCHNCLQLNVRGGLRPGWFSFQFLPELDFFFLSFFTKFTFSPASAPLYHSPSHLLLLLPLFFVSGDLIFLLPESLLLDFLIFFSLFLILTIRKGLFFLLLHTWFSKPSFQDAKIVPQTLFVRLHSFPFFQIQQFFYPFLLFPWHLSQLFDRWS